MELHISFPKNKAKYIAIYEQIRQYISEKTFLAHEKLPTKRQLANDLKISVQTVQLAYEQLLSEGYIYSKERSGYFVSEIDVEWQAMETGLPFTTSEQTATPFYDLRNGQVDSSIFPLKTWHKLYKEQLQQLDFSNAPWQGVMALREEIVRYVMKARGIACKPEQVFLYSGTQQQLHVLMQFLKPTTVAIEDPGFIRAKAVFEQNDLHVTAIPVDHKGATIPPSSAQVYYVTPAHQFPLGYVMPIERKQQLLHWANETECYIIEDDYDAEFRYQGRPIPALRAIDSCEKVIYFGSFSKTLIPSLRISYMILPPHLVHRFEQFNRHQKATVSKIDQNVVAHMMQQGLYEKHITRMRTLYKRKQQILMQALTTNLPPDFNILGYQAGLHVIIQLPKHLTETYAIKRAKSIQIVIDSVSTSYMFDKPTQFIMIGFGAIAINEIETVIQKLAEILQ